jgi:hypothetical protein
MRMNDEYPNVVSSANYCPHVEWQRDCESLLKNNNIHFDILSLVENFK